MFESSVVDVVVVVVVGRMSEQKREQDNKQVSNEQGHQLCRNSLRRIVV